MPKRPTLVALSILCSIALAAPAFAAVTPAQKCASAKMKASGKKFGAKAKCYAKALSQSAAVDAACLQLAEQKFVAAFDKAELPAGCLHESDAATIEAKIDAPLADIVGDLGCGNAQVEGDEVCDDGNLVNGDGCSSECVGSSCGDGFVDVMESCDDGNQNDGDGCASYCGVESGFGCAGEPSVCTTTCGDGIVAGAEGCDDGNQVAGDGCTGMCTVEVGYSCSGQPSACFGICGDGVVVGAEGCDDLNQASGDGCTGMCTVEGGYSCIGEPSVCTPTCFPDGQGCMANANCCSNNCVLGPNTCQP